MSTTITLPKEYGYVLLAAVGMGFHLYMTGGRYAGGARKKAFGAAFFDRLKKSPAGQQLIEDHKKATGSTDVEKTMKGGYPDMGNGRFSEHLTYEEWLMFNNAQRAHYNYLEAVVPALSCLLISGLAYPTVAAGLGAMYIVGREIYASGYSSKGPQARNVGGTISALAMVSMFGTAVYAGLKIAQVVQ